MAEQGFILDIDTQFLQRLEKADRALDKMVSSVDRVASSLDGLASGSLSKFANSIDQIVSSINGVSQAKVGDMGFSEATNSVSQTVDKVNDLVGAIREVSNESAKSNLSFDVSDYESPAKVQALIEKNRAALERAQTRLPKWEGRLSESLKTDPEQSKKSTQGVAMRVREINDEIKTLNETYNQLSQRLVVARERTQELLNASRQGGFKDIATMTAIKRAQKERIESGGFSDRAEQQKYVDAYLDANKQIKDQYKSTSDALNVEDEERYQLWLMQKHTETKEHKRLEDEKYKATEDAIRKQNEAYAKQEALDEVNKRRREKEWEQEASIARENAANKRKAQSVIDNYIKETNAARDSYEKRRKMYEDLFKQQEEQERRTLSGAMSFSQGAGSISERQQAIKYLSEARDSLNESQFNSAKEYKKAIGNINKEINRQKTYIDELQGKHKSLINTADQLKRAFTLAFSVSAIRGYINQIIRVRGEFELQQRALQAILQSKSDADAIWERTIALAVRSPFQIKELVTYTKQLAAYRIEADKLYDTNKMLADISAGLGVDMSRLILAFGQVKAANYLRGTELRQFSEAGINILSELAEYFTEIENRTVRVGEVFERVSKRMVTFADVETVLRRVTSKGGIFYNMQEIQAETLKGQISNLKDSLDLMLNEIGKNNEGVLKGSIGVARVVLDNWRTVAAVMQSAIAIFAVLTAARIKDAIVTGAWSARNLEATASTKGLTAAVARLIVGLKGLWAAIASNPLTAGLAVVSAIGVAVYKYAARQRELNKAYEESIGKIVAVRVETEAYSKVLISLAKQQEELVEANKPLNKESDEYKSNQAKIVEIEKERKDILDELKKSAPEFAERIKSDIRNTNALTKAAFEYNEELRARLALEAQLKETPEDVEDYNERYTKYQAQLGKVEAQKSTYIKAAEDFLRSGSATKEQTEALNEFLSSTEAFHIRIQKLRVDLSKGYRSSFDNVALSQYLGFNYGASDEVSELKRLESLLNRASKRIKDDLTTAASTIQQSDFGESAMSVILDVNATEEDKNKAKNRIVDAWKDVLSDKKIPDSLAEDASEIFSNIFSFDPKKYGTTSFHGWQVGYNKLLDEINKEAGIKGLDITPETVEDDQLKLIQDKIKEQNDIISKHRVKGQGVITDEELANAKEALPILKRLEAFLGGSDKDTGGDKESKTLSNRIRLVKELYEEYNKLRKAMGHTEASSEVSSAYQDSFDLAFGGTGISLGDFDFTSINGLIAMLEKLKPIAEKEGHEAKIALQKEIGEVAVQLKVDERTREDSDFAQAIEDMFADYELSLELEKLNIPSDFAKNFFGLQAVDLSDIRERLEQEKSLNKEISKDRMDKIEESLQKVKELETKAQQERLKKYLVYARDSVGERAKIKLEEMKKLQEIELAFAPKAGESAIDRDIRETAKRSAIEGVQSDAYQAERKLEWEEFQKSDTFISIFQDLDMASEALINHALAKLREFKDSWVDMPHEDMKSIVKNIEELESRLIEMRNPFEAYKTLRDELKGVGSIEELQLDNITQEAKIEALDKEIGVSEQVLSLRMEGKDLEADELAMSKERLDLFGATTKETRDIVKAQKDNKQLAQDQITANNTNISKHKQLKKSLTDQADAIQKAQKMANDLYDAFKELNDVVGDDDGPAAVFAEMGMSMANSVLNCLALQVQLKVAKVGADAFGKAMNSAMGIIGWIVMAIQIIASVLKSVFAAHDNKLEKQIQRIQERIDELQKQFEKLDELMDSAFSTQQIESYSKAAQQNMQEQIAAYEQMIALEEDKKKTDHGKIKEWREEMDELKESYKELIESGFNVATGGILEDTIGVARDFVDTWYEAFKETGDGLSGLKNNFKDMFKELISQQAALQIIGPYIDQYKTWLKQYVDVEKGDSTLTIEEARMWANKVQSTFPEINNLLENFFEGTQDLMQEQGELSELSKGIQGVTESTAQIIEALLNSMRFFVADSNLRLKNIESAFSSNDITRNPILNELQQHTQLIRSIESMFSSVIGRGSSTHAGAYLKVSM